MPKNRIRAKLSRKSVKKILFVFFHILGAIFSSTKHFRRKRISYSKSASKNSPRTKFLLKSVKYFFGDFYNLGSIFSSSKNFRQKWISYSKSALKSGSRTKFWRKSMTKNFWGVSYGPYISPARPILIFVFFA